MKSGQNRINNKSDNQLIITQTTIEADKQDSDERTKKLTSDLTEMITSIMDQIKISKYSPEKRDSPKAEDPTTVVPANKKAPPLQGGNSMRIGGIWTLKHEIALQKFYELIIKTELTVDTDLDLNNFYNHISMCLNAVTRLCYDLLPVYQSIKIHSEFEE